MKDDTGYDPEEDILITDNPFWDCTDGAHPAWWRGCDYGIDKVIEIINDVLDGKNVDPTFSSKALTDLCSKIIMMMTGDPYEKARLMLVEAAKVPPFERFQKRVDEGQIHPDGKFNYHYPINVSKLDKITNDEEQTAVLDRINDLFDLTDEYSTHELQRLGDMEWEYETKSWEDEE